ncbi:MAG: hypothetical protein KatS3mg124_0061 [Porticoccaceae bacterium]|nr:MAG: hypothetical protein KatS3mg124_0061 [Porticoccaceae bacterium]
MSAEEIDRCLLAHWLATGAAQLSIAGRFYPYGDLVSSVADKIRLGARPFGPTVQARAVPVAKKFLDLVIEQGGFSTTQPKIGLPMHQFQPQRYREVVRALCEADELVREAQGADPEFWQRVFAACT